MDIKFRDLELRVEGERALPYFPLGFTRFGAEHVAAGLKDGNTVYLAVWCLGDGCDMEVPIKEGIRSVRMGFPYTPNATLRHDGAKLHLSFAEPQSAAFLVIETAE